MNTGKTPMRAIVNVSTTKYYKGQRRLLHTLNMHCKEDIFMFTSEEQVGARPHKERMYGFKPKSFEKLYDIGYTSILWLDASMYVLKDLTPIFDQIERDGYYWQDSGFLNKQWTPESVKNYMGTDAGIMISSGVVGLDLTNPIGKEFLERWSKASDDGMFNGSHEVFRHDQSAASLIIEQMKLKITPNHIHWMYGKPEETYPENILLLADGIV